MSATQGYFRLLKSASGPRTGLPGPVLGRFWSQTHCERTKNLYQTAWHCPSRGSMGREPPQFKSGDLVVLKTICYFPPSPGGVPGEGPDCHFPTEIMGFGPMPGRIRR